MVVKRSLSLSLALEGFRVKMLALHVLGYLMPVLLFVTHAKIRAIQSGIVHPARSGIDQQLLARARRPLRRVAAKRQRRWCFVPRDEWHCGDRCPSGDRPALQADPTCHAVTRTVVRRGGLSYRS